MVKYKREAKFPFEVIVMETKYAFQDGYIVNGEFVEIDKAQKFQDSLRQSKVVKCSNTDIENKIFRTDPRATIIVKSTINSPKTIISVESYNKEFLEKSL